LFIIFEDSSWQEKEDIAFQTFINDSGFLKQQSKTKMKAK
jgi:hypothetical protein